MMRLRTVIGMALLMLALAGAYAAPQAVMVLPINGAIGPASADFVVRNIARAETERAQLVVLQIDTPGGLDTSMRQIIKAILTSSVPVAAFVAPGGARAASAGTYILYACHLAGMAPGTNLGAATPVQLGGGPQPLGGRPRNGRGDDQDGATTEAHTAKAVNDAAAYIRGLAELRGRNADWAERAVRASASLSAKAALEQGVVEILAADIQ